MSFRTTRSTSAVLAAIFCATAAQADVTAEQVWQDWKDYYTSLGNTIAAGSEAREGDTLVVKDLKLGKDQAEMKVDGTVAEVRLREMGDGKVEVTFSPEMPFTLHASPADGTPTDMTVIISQKDARIIVSGTPEAMDLDFTAPEMAMAMDEVKVDGANPPLKVQLTAKNSAGKSHSEKADGRTLTSEFTTGSIDLAMAGADPETGNNFNIAGLMNGLAGNSKVVVPANADMKDMNAAVQAGFAVDGAMTYSDGNFKVEGSGTDGNFAADSSGGAGKLNFKIGKDGIAYGGETGASKLSVTAPEMPFPIEAELGQSAFNFVMPVSKSDAAQPAAMLIKLVDLKVSDALWNMVDPSSQLPRDPATLIIDVSGAVKPLVDLFDPNAAKSLEAEAADPMATPAPFEVSEAKINQLQVKAVGAELTGTGAMTFDNSTGTPMPLGAIDLSLTGANGLMEKLVAMGLMPEDQVMGMRMMLGMFAVPAGEDALTSKIEFKEGGSIFANGQQIQ